MTFFADEPRRGSMIPHAGDARSMVYYVTKLATCKQTSGFTLMTDGIVFINIYVHRLLYCSDCEICAFESTGGTLSYRTNE